MSGPALALHGGAGAFSSARIPAQRVQEMRSDLGVALAAGMAILERGGPALEAVVAAVRVLEDSRVFNAARGAVLRRDGSVRLDASVMCGASQRAGAVSLVRRVQNPVQLARAVLEREQEVLLCGDDADELAAELGLPLQPPAYFITDYRASQLQRLRQRASAASADASGDGAEPAEEEGQTVGAVALDAAGHLAAATSTGGTTNARVGRIGDSPILGAGTWACDASCAVSATGAGEFFLRAAFAHDLHARSVWQGVSLDTAARQALAHVVQLGGHGGCVALDRRGNLAAPFTTLAMPRAYQNGAGLRRVCVLEPDEPSPA
jgi:isoaspartyl peptidase/L-asparaginase-like protein (Ntn-hydrolase superfamily)